jgi:hypothetical protein
MVAHLDRDFKVRHWVLEHRRFLAVMTALLRLPCCYGWIKWVPRLCARLEPPDNRRLRRGRLGPERQRSPREKAASVGATLGLYFLIPVPSENSIRPRFAS